MMPPVLPTYEGEKLENILISREEVEKILHSLKSSSPGPDGVHPEVIGNCAKSLSRPLTMIFQESLKLDMSPMTGDEQILHSSTKRAAGQIP